MDGKPADTPDAPETDSLEKSLEEMMDEHDELMEPEDGPHDVEGGGVNAVNISHDPQHHEDEDDRHTIESDLKPSSQMLLRLCLRFEPC